ncbi:hypothetical protein LX32DRAFT_73111 [Colletotrichum zoysiae]|uniref:Uncharacterized protein n=1 Tax=Colletotrichum zoysiae TaxID=1216348 RepID=A0AAD9HQR9_9PEZI|nr:hypothetical protein LX32DRAFT_73111 [Colletotrichum zoysiae]
MHIAPRNKEREPNARHIDPFFFFLSRLISSSHPSIPELTMPDRSLGVSQDRCGPPATRAPLPLSQQLFGPPGPKALDDAGQGGFVPLRRAIVRFPWSASSTRAACSSLSRSVRPLWWPVAQRPPWPALLALSRYSDDLRFPLCQVHRQRGPRGVGVR